MYAGIILFFILSVALGLLLNSIVQKQRRIALLRRGTAVWNAWAAHKDCVDLRGAALGRGPGLGGQLAGAYLKAAYLTNAKLEYTDLSLANLIGADLSGAFLAGANLSSAGLGSANLRSANLTDADLRGADLSLACLHDAILVNAKLAGTDLTLTEGLTQEQLGAAKIDSETKLPIDLRSHSTLEVKEAYNRGYRDGQRAR